MIQRGARNLVQDMTHTGTLRRSTGLAAFAALAIALAAPAYADGDAARGEAHFKECAACHSVEKGVNNVGPSLNGVFGRAAGTAPDFRYSNAMKRSGMTWTAQTIDEFIADPQKRIPGNRMPYSGLTDAAARADLIAYLEKATK
jgi:cytochrome c2